jgi:predicted RNA-binding Zn-ribbon protein involved in translation (DUF1610 family)
METIKIDGYSIGDMSVGIPECHFMIDTGVSHIFSEDRIFIINNIIKTIWELHDNGDIRFNFSDEISKEDWDYTRTFNGAVYQKFKCPKCGEIMEFECRGESLVEMSVCVKCGNIMEQII